MPVASAEIVQSQSQAQASPPSRIGRKAISGYFSQEMSLAMHLCARRRGISLQDLMAEAFNDVLRKHGESPIGK
ncbi:ribbon-helix-helix domain-containing protein [Novosphingobium resinovorum]